MSAWLRFALTCSVALVTLLVVGGLGLKHGMLQAGWPQIADALTGSSQEPLALVVRELRLPRFLVGALVGAALAVAGCSMQALTRNPLADPTLTGVVSGAALAVVTATLLFPELPTTWYPWCALAGGFASAALSLALAWRDRLSPTRLALAGMTVAALASAVITALLMRAGPQAGPLFYWLSGGLAGRGWPQFSVIWPWALAGIAATLATCRVLDIMQLGDDTAESLGVQLGRWRLWHGLAAVALAAGVVAVAGPVGFVGLAVPHLARLLVGSAHVRLLPAAALLGAALVCGADLLARTLAAPRELPLGFLTALFAAPFFIALARRVRGEVG
ncbi:FecCD family ABC transporter permease [Andreprevotia chitinilytica]|uniref:FecCD family ABC transporter permease n=1 Tax=Andreprevotia chitinilytica TaxID=396808 RepID=UPI00068A0B37|nr:iron ABC transporter permease [Andreprevotia chitinilytica]